MFDPSFAKEAFRAAVQKLSRGDPYALAKIFQVPPVALNKSEGSNSASQESLQDENGTDWSGVLSSWLDACEASAVVSAAKHIR
jgi:hypothetical protein